MHVYSWHWFLLCYLQKNAEAEQVFIRIFYVSGAKLLPELSRKQCYVTMGLGFVLLAALISLTTILVIRHNPPDAQTIVEEKIEQDIDAPQIGVYWKLFCIYSACNISWQ